MAMPKIYIDPGHGGTDAGAIGVGGVKEKDITLAVAKYLHTELKRQDFDVLMSRTTDTSKSLSDRTSEANRWGAAAVVSIHCNGFEDASANGTETFVYKYGYKAEMLANNVQINLVTVLGTKNRGVKEGNLAMVRDTNAPSILIELAFITNKNDCAKLTTSTYQKECAIAICKGICRYFGVTYKKEETKVANKTKFKDESKMSRGAIASIKRVSDLKIMNGDPDGNFRPKDSVTREELAIVIDRVINELS